MAPAEAITIHKSQGSTYSSIAYHVGKYITHSSAYVALSRATSAKGLYIIGDLKTSTTANSIVTAEIERLRSHPTAQEYDDLLSRPASCYKIVSFNIQSLLPHIKAVITDPALCNSDLICLLETWTTESDIVNVEGFTVVSRIDSGRVRKPSGLIILAKNSVKCESISTSCLGSTKFNLHAAVVKLGLSTYVVTVYSSPQTPNAALQTTLNSCMKCIPNGARIVLTGDFNMSHKTLSHILQNPFTTRNMCFVSPSEPSTYHNSQIDLTYSNTSIHASYYDSFLSYHRPQVLLVPRRCLKKKARDKKKRTRLPTPTIAPRSKSGMTQMRRLRTSSSVPSIYRYHYRKYLRALCRKRNRHKIWLPQHKLRTS